MFAVCVRGVSLAVGVRIYLASPYRHTPAISLRHTNQFNLIKVRVCAEHFVTACGTRKGVKTMIYAKWCSYIIF